jgi:hypothetical protein
MMLIAALTIWLVLLVFAVMLCRIAADADSRDVAFTERYPSRSATGPRTLTIGLVCTEEEPAPVPRDLRAKVPGARGRAERYAAGS